METQKYKDLLEEEKVRLEKELENAGSKDRTTGDWQGASDNTEPAIDPNEAADQIEELTNNVPIVESLEARLKSVQAALDNIEAGTYGVCSECGEKIPEERLEANPAATTCVSCAK